MAESRRKPPPPAALGRRGRAFWKKTVTVYDITDAEAEVLAEACCVLDNLEDLRASIADAGVIVAGAGGLQRVNPAVAEARQLSLALGRLVAQLNLPDEEGNTVQSPASIRARNAAQKRWAQRDGLRARRAAAGGNAAP